MYFNLMINALFFLFVGFEFVVCSKFMKNDSVLSLECWVFSIHVNNTITENHNNESITKVMRIFNNNTASS